MLKYFPIAFIYSCTNISITYCSFGRLYIYSIFPCLAVMVLQVPCCPQFCLGNLHFHTLTSQLCMREWSFYWFCDNCSCITLSFSFILYNVEAFVTFIFLHLVCSLLLYIDYRTLNNLIWAWCPSHHCQHYDFSIPIKFAFPLISFVNSTYSSALTNYLAQVPICPWLEKPEVMLPRFGCGHRVLMCLQVFNPSQLKIQGLS